MRSSPSKVPSLVHGLNGDAYMKIEEFHEQLRVHASTLMG